MNDSKLEMPFLPSAPALRDHLPFLIAVLLRLAFVSPFRVFRGLLIALSFCTLSLPAAESLLYENNFEKAEVGNVPADFMVLDGGFAVKEEAGNKFLELPGAPLDSFGVQFGSTESSNLCVSARIFAT